MRRGTLVRAALFFVVFAVFLVFAVRNNDDVIVDFFGVEQSVSLTWLMLTCAAIGLVIGAFLMSRASRRARR